MQAVARFHGSGQGGRMGWEALKKGRPLVERIEGIGAGGLLGKAAQQLLPQGLSLRGSAGGGSVLG
jgi:hypothetical protein